MLVERRKVFRSADDNAVLEVELRGDIVRARLIVRGEEVESATFEMAKSEIGIDVILEGAGIRRLIPIC